MGVPLPTFLLTHKVCSSTISTSNISSPICFHNTIIHFICQSIYSTLFLIVFIILFLSKNPKNFNRSWDLTLSILIVWLYAVLQLRWFRSVQLLSSALPIRLHGWHLLPSEHSMSVLLLNSPHIYFNIIPLLLSFPPYIARNAILTVRTAYESHWKQMDFHIK